MKRKIAGYFQEGFLMLTVRLARRETELNLNFGWDCCVCSLDRKAGGNWVYRGKQGAFWLG
jgi:hypothetical protein